MDARTVAQRKRKLEETYHHNLSVAKTAKQDAEESLQELTEFNYNRLRDILLAPDCIHLIAKRIATMWDYRSVRLVCKSWNQAITDNDTYWRARVWTRKVSYYSDEGDEEEGENDEDKNKPENTELTPRYQWIVERWSGERKMLTFENGRSVKTLMLSGHEDSPRQESFIYDSEAELWVGLTKELTHFGFEDALTMWDGEGNSIAKLYQNCRDRLRFVLDSRYTRQVYLQFYVLGNLPTHRELRKWVKSPLSRFCEFVCHLMEQEQEEIRWYDLKEQVGGVKRILYDKFHESYQKHLSKPKAPIATAVQRNKPSYMGMIK